MCRDQSPSTKKQSSGQNAEYFKKEVLEKKFQTAIYECSPKDKSTQTSSSVFAERIEKAKKTKFELQLIKTVDCFLGVHGLYDFIFVSFEKKCLLDTIFFVTLSRSNECSQRIQKVS